MNRAGCYPYFHALRDLYSEYLLMNEGLCLGHCAICKEHGGLDMIYVWSVQFCRYTKLKSTDVEQQ